MNLSHPTGTFVHHINHTGRAHRHCAGIHVRAECGQPVAVVTETSAAGKRPNRAQAVHNSDACINSVRDVDVAFNVYGDVGRCKQHGRRGWPAVSAEARAAVTGHSSNRAAGIDPSGMRLFPVSECKGSLRSLPKLPLVRSAMHWSQRYHRRYIQVGSTYPRR